MTFLDAGTIISTAVAEVIGSTSSLATGLQTSQLVGRVQSLNASFVTQAYTKHPLKGLSWMRVPTVINTVAGSTLSAGVSAGDSTYTLTSASDFPSSGRSVIYSQNILDFVDHSSKSTNTLTVSSTTGAQTISTSHDSGTAVEKLYAVPSDFLRPYALKTIGGEYRYKKFDASFPEAGSYSIYGDYILFPQSIGTSTFTLVYDKKPATITASTDTTDIPDIYSRWIIEMLKAHICLLRRQRQDVNTYLTLAAQELADIYMMDATSTSNPIDERIPLPY